MIDEDTLRQELATAVRAEIGLPRASLVDGNAETRSGKILRRSMRAIADGRDDEIPATIEDPEVLEGLRPT